MAPSSYRRPRGLLWEIRSGWWWRSWDWAFVLFGRSWWLRLWTTKRWALEFRFDPGDHRPGRLRIGTVELSWLRLDRCG